MQEVVPLGAASFYFPNDSLLSRLHSIFSHLQTLFFFEATKRVHLALDKPTQYHFQQPYHEEINPYFLNIDTARYDDPTDKLYT